MRSEGYSSRSVSVCLFVCLFQGARAPPLSMYILTQVKLTSYCFATLSLLLKLVAFVFKLKIIVVELAISRSKLTATVNLASLAASLLNIVNSKYTFNCTV